MVVPFLKPGMIITSGVSKILQELDRENRPYYSIEYTGTEKKGMVLKGDVDLMKKLGIEITPHWNYPDSKEFFGAIGIRMTLYSRVSDVRRADPLVGAFLKSSQNEDFTMFLNQEDVFGNG